MTIRDLHNPYKPDATALARGTSGSRIQLANAGGEADAWLEPMLSDFISLATSLCAAPIGMVTQLHADIGLQHPFVSVVNGRGDIRNQWWRFPGQNGVSRTAVDFSLCQYAARRPRELTEIADLRADPRFGESALANGTPQVNFYAAVPLVSSNGDVMGTLCVMDRQPRQLTAVQRDAFLKLGRQLEGQLESRRTMQKLEQQTLTDALTGIGNRRSFDLRLREEWTRHLRNARPLSMLMVDVDYFKQYNDTYGHPAGDALLSQLARVLRSPLRASDFLARYGGDEFSLILPDTDEIGAHQVGERIKRAVSMVKWPHTDIEISLGAATVTPSEMCDFHALLQAADKAKYQRKHGRNPGHA
ncbi:MAG: Phytochrome-like protein cph2 [Herbaspirillum frisingense]|uniref:diguanylate cyclase n=1 Tax=Herbaspirillum frisingense TaxID=92645 RepID=A0A7V8FXC9_9BURK|nr:MAG: Phytochrome-like protein cph2 [Herbaspirillum frisingense]